MTLDERHSAWLDGELDASEAAAVEAELASDPTLAAEVESLRAVRSLLRDSATIDLRADAGAHFVARVEALDADRSAAAASPSVVELSTRRRRIPTFAAVAASFAIIVSVIGGVGGDTTLPAVGDLIARHDAAAAEMPKEPMDDTMPDMPKMDGAMDMMAADESDGVAHAVYVAADGSVVSIFRSDGELDDDALVDDMGGSMGEVDGHAMWAKDIGARHVAILDGDGYVWTIVSDVDVDPMADLMNDMMDELPERSPSLAERLHDLAEAVVEPFGLGG